MRNFSIDIVWAKIQMAVLRLAAGWATFWEAWTD